MTPEENSLWDRVRTPNPAHVKQFKRAGGFQGSSVNGTYLVQRATEEFGLNGTGWGVEIDDEAYVKGAPLLNDKGEVVGREIVHVLRGRVWYLEKNEKRYTSPQYGQTIFVGRNKYGPFTDEEAPKKSVTDLMSKCLSLLGFAADIHLGRWDDNKYVAEVAKGFSNGQAGAPKTAPPKAAPPPPTEGEPREIPMGDLTSVQWGGQFIATIKECQSLGDLNGWVVENAKTISGIMDSAPKAHASVIAAIEKVRADLMRIEGAASESTLNAG